MDEFDFCIARPWDDPADGLCVYAYHSEIHRGTMADAQQLLDYVNQQREPDEPEYAIYRLSFEKV